MSLFYIDVNKIIKDIIDAYTCVYGEEYYNIISSKIKNSIIIQYYDIDGFDDYISFIKRCKRKELAIDFLTNIGFQTEEYLNGCFFKPLSEETRNLLESFLGSEYTCFDTRLDNYFSPLCAFNSDNCSDKEKILDNKIKFINFIRKNDGKKINRDNFSSFSKSLEYQILSKRIFFYLYVYKRIAKKYMEFENKLKVYEEFISNERENLKNEFYKNKVELFNMIFPEIPDDVKFILKNKPINEQYEILIGSRDLSFKTPIEYFSINDMNKLKDDSVSLDEKYWIIFFQTNYLKNLNVKFTDDYILSIENNDFVTRYINFINQDEILKLIPNHKLIDRIEEIRNECHQNAIYNYYINRDDFKENYARFIDTVQNKNFLFQQIVNNDVCVIDGGAHNVNNEFFSIMFFTFKKNFAGKLNHCFVHELGHIIDQNENGCGFETNTYLCNTCEKSPFNSDVRKYEKFNETINDIYTIRVLDILKDRNIYPIEDKTISCPDTSSFNTSIYLKRLLYPLVEKYEHYVSKAKIYANPNYLIEAIGLKNYEDLVFVVNKVYFLLNNGLFSVDNSTDELENEYYEQISNLEVIYNNIDEYHNCIKHILCI